jgi:hypothetical protein
MENKTKLTVAVLAAMGASGSTLAEVDADLALANDQTLDLPIPGTAEYEAAANDDTGAFVYEATQAKKKKKKGVVCLIPGTGMKIYLPLEQCPPGLQFKKKK